MVMTAIIIINLVQFHGWVLWSVNACQHLSPHFKITNFPINYTATSDIRESLVTCTTPKFPMVKGLGSFTQVKVSHVTIPIIKVAELVLGSLSSLPMESLNK